MDAMSPYLICGDCYAVCGQAHTGCRVSLLAPAGEGRYQLAERRMSKLHVEGRCIRLSSLPAWLAGTSPFGGGYRRSRSNVLAPSGGSNLVLLSGFTLKLRR